MLVSDLSGVKYITKVSHFYFLNGASTQLKTMSVGQIVFLSDSTPYGEWLMNVLSHAWWLSLYPAGWFCLLGDR